MEYLANTGSKIEPILSTNGKAYSVVDGYVKRIIASYRVLGSNYDRKISVTYNDNGYAGIVFPRITAKYVTLNGIVDTLQNGNATIRKISGAGDIIGYTQASFVSGVALFDNLIFSEVGDYQVEIRSEGAGASYINMSIYEYIPVVGGGGFPYSLPITFN